MLKRTLCLVLGLLCAIPVPSYALTFHDTGYDTPDHRYPIVESDMPVTIHIDGKYLPTDVDPILISDRTMVPLRVAGEALGATIDWNGSDQSITVTKDNNTILFHLYSTLYYVNGMLAYSDVAPLMIQNRTLLPLRVFAESMKADVHWDQNLCDVQIDTPNPDQQRPALPAEVPADVEKLITKYYVSPDPSDPFVGSWANPPYYYDSQYIFVGKTASNQYQVASIRWYWSYGTPRPFITLKKEPAFVNTNHLLERKNNPEPIYYFGMQPQYPFSNSIHTDYYSINNTTLTHIGGESDFAYTPVGSSTPTTFVPDSVEYVKF